MMGMPEIFLEHRRGEKMHKQLRVGLERELFLIGSSKEADLRLNGEGVMGCHAVLRYRAPEWFVCDVSGTESLKVDGKIVSEARIDESTKVEIAGHRIQLFKKERKGEVFSEEPSLNKGALSLHQVVVLRKGRVVETHLLSAGQPFVSRYDDTKTSLVAPTSSEWVKTQIGSRTVQQRLVESQEMALAEKLTFDRDLRKPFVIAFLMLFVLSSAVMFLGSRTSKTPEVALDKKSMDMIFNAKAVKMKKAESQKIVKTAKVRAGAASNNAPVSNAKANLPDESTAPKVSSKATAALTSLRNSGLGSLIGKIAKRANKQGVMVAAVGVSPDTAGAGRAFFSHGTSTVGGGGSAAKEGDSYRLGGIATKGKAGGVGNFKDGTALAGGSVGTGNVLALSDDEETMVDGGLDRDAIADVIRRNLGQIRYCYERQLSSTPDLYGKVLVKFTIGSAGEVVTQNVSQTTLKSAMVEGCILRRMASWKFPLPKGGTEVRVSYPFLFKALQ